MGFLFRKRLHLGTFFSVNLSKPGVGLLLAAWLLSGCAVPAGTVGTGGQPSQTIEFYDAGGQHLGYGRVQGGTVELFNADSSRAGFGKVGR